MKTVWTKGLNEEQKTEMRTAFLQNTLIRERIIGIALEKQDTSRKERITKDAYDVPNWGFKQADACGYERAWQELISIFTI